MKTWKTEKIKTVRYPTSRQWTCTRVKLRFQIQGPYSPTILKKVLSLVLQILLSLEAFECNTHF